MSKQTADNAVPGPTFLEGFTEHIPNPSGLHDHEWRRRLCLPNGRKKFRIKYYGELLNGTERIITGTDFSEVLVIAGEEPAMKQSNPLQRIHYDSFLNVANRKIAL